MAIGDDQISYIFGGNTGLTYEQLKRRRAVAQALASQRRGYPKNVGEGLTYLGESFGDLMAERRLDAAEKAMSARGMAALNPQLEPPMTAPVAPPSSTRPASPPAPPRPPPVSAAPIPRPPPPPPPPPPPVLPSGPSGEALTSGLPPSEFAAGGMLSPAPLAAPGLDPVFPEGSAATPPSSLSSGYLPPPATAAVPPSTPPSPPVAAPTVNAIDTAEYPVGPVLAPPTSELQPPPSPQWKALQDYRESQGLPREPPPDIRLRRPGGAPAPAPPAGDAPGSILGPQSALDRFIAKQEGFRPTAYWDYKQYSIGHGTRGRPGETISREEAGQRLQSEVANARQSVEDFAPDAPPGVKDALTSLTYNAGSGWQQSGLGRMIREGRYDEARDRFQQYIKAGGTPLPGLASRRQAELSNFWDQPQQDGGGNIQLASYAPSGGAGGAPIPGMGGAGSPRLGGSPPAPDEQVTPTDIEPAPAMAQFGPPVGQFSRSDAPIPGIPRTAPLPSAASPPIGPGAGSPMAGQPVSPAPLPLDPGPEPRMSGPTPAMQHYRSVAADPAQSDSTRAIAQSRYEEELRAQREDFKNHWLVWKTEKLKFDDPATRIQLEQAHLNAEKTRRDLEGEGFQPLTPAELAGLPKPPEGQIIYANRRGELKFGPTPPASTTVNVDTKATGKGQEALQTKMAEQFVEMFTAGNTAADDLRTVTEMRELATRVGTGPGAVAKQFAGRWGIKTEGVSDIEALNAMINRIIPQQRVPGSGTSSDFDSRMFQASVPALMNTPGGNALIMDTMDGAARNRMARSEVAGKVISGQLTVQEGVKETLALQAQARALSDRVKDFIDKGGVKPGETTGPTRSREIQRALDWATQNPTDPRAQEIQRRYGAP